MYLVINSCGLISMYIHDSNFSQLSSMKISEGSVSVQISLGT